MNDLDILESGLGSLFWTRVVVPKVQGKLKPDIDLLLSVKRDASVNDDYLRGRIETLRWFLRYFEDLRNELRQEVAVAQAPQPVVVGSPYAQQPGDVPENGGLSA